MPDRENIAGVPIVFSKILNSKHMDVLHEGDKRQGAFFVSGENGRLAELNYRRTAASEITIDHTDVAKSLAGCLLYTSRCV